MGFQFPEMPNMSPGVTYGIIGLVTAVVVITRLWRGPNLDSFPTVGSSTLLGSWWASYKFVTNAADVLQEGYEKYNSAPFKVADKYVWMVVFSSQEHIEEMRKAPDDVFSFTEAVNDRLSTDYTLGRDVRENPYHVAVVRSQLTRNLGKLYPEIIDEVVASFDEVLDLTGNEWKSVPALSTIQKVVCRTSNRLFIGLPLCRDPDWIDLNIRYTVDIIKVGLKLGFLPKIFRPLGVYFFSDIAQGKKRGLKHLGPMIEERLKYSKEYGSEWDAKPNDVLSWLMEETEESQLTVESLVARVLVTNFGAIHTSSNSFTHALFYLAANPQYIRPLREEVERIVEEDGWTKAALGKMRKVDSFLKECQRIEGTSILTLGRKVLKDYTFSDGTFVPKGTLVGVPSRCIHRDERFYENANVFDPFRFADLHEEEGEDVKHQFVSTGTEYLSFGHGRHACPGRFFAANELKSMLAHVVVAYDVKLEENTTRPPSLYFGTAILANPYGKVLFRKRV